MTTNRLTELLEETSAGVVAPSFAATAWERSRRVRRRRRLAVSMAAFIAVAAVVVPLNSGNSSTMLPGRKPVPGLPTRSPAPQSTVDLMPAALPQRAIAALPSTFTIPADVRKLSEHPVDQAVAVVQEHDLSPAGDLMPPLHVLDPEGNWTRIDVGGLVRTRDEGGNQADPLSPASLSPDRRRVAVPQPQAVVVIDLTTAKAHRIPVPGLNEQVMWWGDAIVLVGADGPGVVRVDWAAGTVTPEPAAISAWNSAGSENAGGELPELITQDGRRSVRVWAMGSAMPLREMPADSDLPGGYGISEWSGPAVPDAAGRVAVTAWGERPISSTDPGAGISGGAEFLAVVSTATGAVERVLDLGPGRSKACCTVLDWIDADTVLAKTDREGLITWNVRDGEIARVTTGPVTATVSIRLR